MTNQEIIIAIAKLDGWNHWFNGWNKLEDNTPPLTLTGHLPDYLTSRDAIIPVIEKVSLTERLSWSKFNAAFFKVIGHDFNNFELLTASPKQLCIALLKATGEWKD